MRIIVPFCIAFDADRHAVNLRRQALAEGEIALDPDDNNAPIYARRIDGSYKSPWFLCRDGVVPLFDFLGDDDFARLKKSVATSPESYAPCEADGVPQT